MLIFSSLRHSFKNNLVELNDVLFSLQKLESKLTNLHNKTLADKMEEHKEAVKSLQIESEESRRAELDIRLMEHKRSLGKVVSTCSFAVKS